MQTIPPFANLARVTSVNARQVMQIINLLALKPNFECSRSFTTTTALMSTQAEDNQDPPAKQQSNVIGDPCESSHGRPALTR
jgi:hypothetical protein